MWIDSALEWNTGIESFVIRCDENIQNARSVIKDEVEQIKSPTQQRNNNIRKWNDALNCVYTMENLMQKEYRLFFEWKTNNEVTKITKWILRKNNIKNIFDIMIFFNNNSLNWDFEVFSGFSAFVQKVYWALFGHNDRRKKLTLLELWNISSNVWFSNFNIMARKVITKNSLNWIKTLEDFKEKKLYTSFDKDITWLDLLRYFLNNNNFSKWTNSTLLLFFKSINKENLIYNFVTVEEKQKLEKDIYFSNLDKEDILTLAKETLIKNNIQNSLDILIWKINGDFESDFEPFIDMLHMYNLLVWVNSSSYDYISVVKINKFSQIIWIPDFEESIKMVLNDNNEYFSRILPESNMYNLGESTFYNKENSKYKISCREIVINFKNYYENKSHSKLTKTDLNQFLNHFNKLALIKTSVKTISQKWAKDLPKELKTKLFVDIYEIVKKLLIKNWLWSVHELIMARNNKDFSWNFAPFDNFAHILYSVFNKDISWNKSINMWTINNLSSTLKLVKLEDSILKKSSEYKEIDLSDDTEVKEFWNTVFFENKKGNVFLWKEIISYYLKRNKINNLTPKMLKLFISIVDK